MSNSISRLLALICLTALLAGCGIQDAPQAIQPTAAAPEPPPTVAIAEPRPTQVPVIAETEASEPTVAETPIREATELPYLQKVSFADQAIYSGPSYDDALLGTVQEAGTYTIVEETWDTEDNLWGRLKSGAGWIDLTQVRQRLEFPEPLSAGYADDRLLHCGAFLHAAPAPDAYAVPVVFRAHETLTDITLWTMELQETMILSEEIFYLSRLEPDTPFVAELSFPGDMTTYAVCFTDSSGNTHCRCISISGRNGALELYEYTP